MIRVQVIMNSPDLADLSIHNYNLLKVRTTSSLPPHPLGDGKGSPGSSDGEESACNAGDPGLIPGSGRSMQKG